MLSQFSGKDWARVNQKLIAKSIGEMSYEEILRPTPLIQTPAHEETGYELRLQSGVRYTFRAWLSLWDYLRVDPMSVVREGPGGQIENAEDAALFFSDTRHEHGMTEIVLANFLEEMHRTLYADLFVLERQKASSVEEFRQMPSDKLQSYLDGHPKILLNKGRMSWGAEDHQRFAPESAEAFRLFWIAADRDCLAEGWDPAWNEESLLVATMGQVEAERLCAARRAAGLDREQTRLLPLHPWQWENIIQLHFVGEIVKKKIVGLGYFGDRYIAQTSLRTLSNLDHPERFQIKLALSILNTSCVRGIARKAIPIAPGLSRWIADILARDEVFLESGTQVLKEACGLSYTHAAYARVEDAPYRFHEYLGAIWRESSESKHDGGERSLLTAALFQRDAAGEVLISCLIRHSGLSAEEWLRRYFEIVVVPLYHLQCRYGVGIVAHGQNTVLLLRDDQPAGLILKDLQGDFRILQEDIAELESLAPFIKDSLTRLPPHYLIHDLLTAHFVTVLRFLSAELWEAMRFSELSFYKILAEVIIAYQVRHPELEERFQSADLLSPKIARILLNKVRMRIGYADSAERPLPELGTELNNPLFIALMQEGQDDAGKHI